MALFWGAFSGDWTTAVALGVFFELLTVDILATGTFVPPNALFPLLWVLSLGSALGFLPPGVSSMGESGLADFGTGGTGVLVIFSLPLMHLGSFVEERHRDWQVAGYIEVLGAYRKGRSVDGATKRSIRRALFQLFGLNAALFLLAGGGLYCAYALFAAFRGEIPHMSLSAPDPGWTPFFAVGILGAFLAIRTKSGYAVFGMLALVVTVYAFFGDIL